jgi:hypothetical protein
MVNPSGSGAPVQRAGSLEEQHTYSDGDLDRLPPRTFPGWLVALTFVCIALFVAGLVVYLRRVEPAPHASSPPADASAAVAPSDGSGAASGMLLVRRTDGSRFYADARPVTVKAFKDIFKAHDQNAKPDDAVVMVSYNEARSFAKTKNNRLLTGDEWTAAAATPGFIALDGVFEWIDSPNDKEKTVRLHRTSETRPDAKHKDVTFRMARNAP